MLDEHLAQRDARLRLEHRQVPVEPLLELDVRRRGLRLGAVDQELELLPQAATDDRVIAVEAHGDRLARGDLLLDVLVDEALQLFASRRAVPRLLEAGRERLDDTLADHDPGRAGPGATALPLEVEEEQEPECEEVEERLAEQGLHGRSRVQESEPPLPAQANQFGVYQIGDV